MKSAKQPDFSPSFNQYEPDVFDDPLPQHDKNELFNSQDSIGDVIEKKKFQLETVKECKKSSSSGDNDELDMRNKFNPKKRSPGSSPRSFASKIRFHTESSEEADFTTKMKKTDENSDNVMIFDTQYQHTTLSESTGFKPAFSKESPKASPSRTRKQSYSNKMPELRKSRQNSCTDLKCPSATLGNTLVHHQKIQESLDEEEFIRQNIDNLYISPTYIQKLSSITPELYDKLEFRNTWYENQTADPSQKKRFVSTKKKGKFTGCAQRDRVVISPPALLPSQRVSTDLLQKLMERTFNPSKGKSEVWNRTYSSSMLGAYKGSLGLRNAEERKSINQFPTKVSNMKILTMQGSMRNQRNSYIDPLRVPKSHKSYQCGESNFIPKQKGGFSGSMMGNANKETHRKNHMQSKMRDFYQSRIF